MSMVITAPNEIYSVENEKNIKLFLAGGITNCPLWQNDLIKELIDIEGITIYNPRRENFPKDDPDAPEEQITWEYDKLRKADIIVFWFSRGSNNPIVLYELGKWGNSSNKPIVIGMDDQYERKFDVRMQTELARPNLNIVHSIDELAVNIKKEIYLNKLKKEIQEKLD